VIAIAIIAVLVLVFLPAFTPQRPHRRVSCQNNLKQMGLVFKMCSNEAKDEQFPPIQSEVLPDKTICLGAAPLIDAIYPEYLTDLTVLLCPSGAPFDGLKDSTGAWVFPADAYSSEKLDPSTKSRLDWSYAYLGWVLDQCGDTDSRDPDGLGALSQNLQGLGLEAVGYPDEAEAPTQLTGLLNAVLEEVDERLRQGEGGAVARRAADRDRILGGDDSTDGNNGTATVHRLREGVERLVVTPRETPDATGTAQGEIWVMFDVLDTYGKTWSHVPGGCNVLYMDGHVEFLRFPGPAPVSRAMAAPIGLLAGAG